MVESIGQREETSGCGDNTRNIVFAIALCLRFVNEFKGEEECNKCDWNVNA